MTTEYVTLAAAGFSYAGWKKVHISAAIKEAARSFDVETTERPGEFAFPPGTPITLLATGSLLVTGYVNRYQSSGDAKTHNVRIQGRGKGQDIIDCSAEHKTGHAKDRTPGEFANELDIYGVGITDRIGLPKVPMQHIKQGETAFRTIERYLRPHGATMMGRADGGIDLTNASVAMRAAGALVEGVNIKAWDVTLSDDDRFSDYTVKGQGRHGTKPQDLRIKERDSDGGVKRRRNRMIVAEGDTDKKRAKDRAKHEKERCAGNGTKATVTAQGWRDMAGMLWEPNTLVFVSSPLLMHLEQDMLIEKIDLTQDDGGTIAKLSLVDPRAYRGQGQDGKRTGKTWNDGTWDGGGVAP